MAITTGLSAPNLALLDETSGKQVTVDEIRDSIDGFNNEALPRNDDWNGYLDPVHTVPIEYKDTSAGTRSFLADTEIAPNLYVSAATDVTFSTVGVSWLAGNSLYKLYNYTPEQLSLIDVNAVPVYLVGQSGSDYFVNNATTGVTVSKPDTTTLKIEIDFAIFSELGITNLWRFFVTERVGHVVELGEVSHVYGSLSVNNLYHIQQTAVSGTNGGTFTSGAWRTRILDTELAANIEGASLLANQITLPPGRYWIEASAPAFRVNENRIRLYNITDAALAISGKQFRCDNAVAIEVRSTLCGELVIDSEKVFELQHKCVVTQTSNGLGTESSGYDTANEIFAEIKIWRLSK